MEDTAKAARDIAKLVWWAPLEPDEVQLAPTSFSAVDLGLAPSRDPSDSDVTVAGLAYLS